MRRNELMRAARGTISRTARHRLLAYFARVNDPKAKARAATARRRRIARGNGGLHEPRARPGGARPAVVP